MKFTAEQTGSYIRHRRRLGFPLFCIILGVILLALSVLILPKALSGDYVKTKAVITRIDDSDPENPVAYVQYYVDGAAYEEVSNSYSSSYEVGKQITVRYNRQNPEEVGGGAGLFGIILLVVGIGSLTFGIRSIRESRKKAADIQADAERAVNETPYEVPDNAEGSAANLDGLFLDGFTPFLDINAQKRTYYFRYAGKANQGHLMETTEYEPVYEAALEKFNLLGTCPYNFINHLTGVSAEHQIGKTCTQEDGRGLLGFTYSYFKFDGENVWDLLKRNGYKIDTEISGLRPAYTLRFGNTPIAEIKTSGTAILKGIKSNALTEKLGTRGLYTIETTPENVPIAFLTAMAFARTEQLLGQ